MYDDYDLDYTIAHDRTLDLDEMYDTYTRSYLDESAYASDLDEEYARDSQDYATLAYQHYA